MKRNLMLALVLLLPSCLSACGPESVKAVPVPPALLSCAAEPSAPAESTDRAVAGFILDLMDAGRDCRSKLAGVKQWSDELEAK